jgi:hypothetical protein
MADALPRRHKASLTDHLHQRRLAHALNAFADQTRPGRWHNVGREGRRQSEQLKSFNVVLFLSVGIAIGMTRRGRHAKRLIGKIDHQLTQRIHIASVQSDSVDVIPRIADRIERERHDIVAIKGSRSIAEVRSRPTQTGRWTKQHVDGSFRGTTAIHVFEPVGKFSAEVVVGPSTSQRPILDCSTGNQRAARGNRSFDRQITAVNDQLSRGLRAAVFPAWDHAHRQSALSTGEEGQHERAGRGADALLGDPA